MINKPKICLVSSPGGHLFHLKRLEKWWGKYPHFWVSKSYLDKSMVGENQKFYYGYFPEQRSVINFFRNLILAWKIISKEKPNIIVSSGAGVAPPFFVIGKIFGCKLIFIEVFDFIQYPTLSGRFVYPLADLFLVQHREQLKRYPKAILVGSIL